ncbi:MAG: nucleoside recognition protein, partial [Clostridiales bacterium]|nr:nucleoside recognition protein [Clostridiales bacterium]
YLWAFMIIIGTAVGIVTGNIETVSNTIISSSKEAVTLCISMLGVMSLWMGIMQVAKAAGIIESFTRLLRPVIRLLFPDIPKDHIANEYIASNIIANILGLGWAATPMGLKAIKELSKLNNNSETASCDMCTFLIINISSLQLIPVNVIAFRSEYGSVNPAEILGAGLVATAVSTVAGILFSIIARKISKKG